MFTLEFSFTNNYLQFCWMFGQIYLQLCRMFKQISLQINLWNQHVGWSFGIHDQIYVSTFCEVLAGVYRELSGFRWHQIWSTSHFFKSTPNMIHRDTHLWSQHDSTHWKYISGLINIKYVRSKSLRISRRGCLWWSSWSSSPKRKTTDRARYEKGEYSMVRALSALHCVTHGLKWNNTLKENTESTE